MTLLQPNQPSNRFLTGEAPPLLGIFTVEMHIDVQGNALEHTLAHIWTLNSDSDEARRWWGERAKSTGLLMLNANPGEECAFFDLGVPHNHQEWWKKTYGTESVPTLWISALCSTVISEQDLPAWVAQWQAKWNAVLQEAKSLNMAPAASFLLRDHHDGPGFRFWDRFRAENEQRELSGEILLGDPGSVDAAAKRARRTL